MELTKRGTVFDADGVAPPAPARPLAGRRVLVTRAAAQAAPLVALLRAAGAEPIECPVIQIEPADGYAGLDAALRRAASYDWLVVTSVNTVEHVQRRLDQLGLDWGAFAGCGVAAIGPKTAAALRERGVAIAYMPRDYVSTAIAAGLPLRSGQRVLLPRADIADKRLVEGLRARGAVADEFVAYRTVAPAHGLVELRGLLAAGAIDAVTFTSASTVRNLCAALGDDAAGLLGRTVVACIGPVSAATARECGLQPAVVAAEYTIDGLVAALVKHFRR